MMRIKNLLYLLVCFVFLASCNMPTAKAPADNPAPSGDDAVGTSVALTTTAKLTELAAAAPDAPAAVVVVAATATVPPPPAATEAPSPTPTFTFTPTPCVGIVTASVVVNVRSGPATAYDVVGNLPIGGTAKVAGRNDANTWWYIEFPSGVGGHAWVAGSVTTASCLPTNLPIIAAPPLPTAPPTPTDVPGSSSGGSGPDLAISEFVISPSTPTQGNTTNVKIVVVNHGDQLASQFTVAWYGLSTFTSPSCKWDVMDIIPPSGSKTLTCSFVFQSWYPINKTSLAVVDTSNHVQESNESNNQSTISPFGVNK